MLDAEKEAEQRERVNSRRLSWIDLSDADDTVGALKLTDPRWAQARGGRLSSDEESPANKIKKETDVSVDVTSLLKRRKPKVENKNASVEALPPYLFHEQTKTMPAFRCLEPEEQISNDDINLLVNTLSQLTDQSTTREPDYMQQPAFDARPALCLPHYPEDSQIIVNYHNLTHWRSLFLTLAFADPETLHTYVSSLSCSPPTTWAGNSHQRSRGRNKPQQTPANRPPPSEGRFKQIARGKSTREYLAYVQAVPKEKRQEGIDPSTPRVEGSSWREFQAEVRAWKRMLHRRYETIQAGNNT